MNKTEEKYNVYGVLIYRKFNLLKLKKEWRWRVTADNGNIIGASTQGYSRYDDCEYNVYSLGVSLTTGKINVEYGE